MYNNYIIYLILEHTYTLLYILNVFYVTYSIDIKYVMNIIYYVADRNYYLVFVRKWT